MSTIDIRDASLSNIDTIIVSERSINGINVAYKISNNYNRINIHDEDEFVCIVNKEHAENMIKAIQKAVQLGWV